jgi:hypothetical protein
LLRAQVRLHSLSFPLPPCLLSPLNHKSRGIN